MDTRNERIDDNIIGQEFHYNGELEKVKHFDPIQAGDIMHDNVIHIDPSSGFMVGGGGALKDPHQVTQFGDGGSGGAYNSNPTEDSDSAHISSDIAETEVEEDKPLIDPEAENPLNEFNQEQLTKMMAQMRDMIGLMEMQWKNTQEEFKLSDSNMKDLYNFNEQYRDPAPDGVDPSDESYDNFNGLNKLTDDDIFNIFGEGHPIIGVDNSQTLDRIRSAFTEFFQWTTAIHEYRQVHNGYMELIEAEEENNLSLLRAKAEAEEDPEKKEKALKALDTYYSTKYLDFIADPLDERSLNGIIKAFSDEKKVSYWIEKTRSKLKQMKISSKVILEISQFEKRFLPEEYHNHSNIFLLYFMTMVMGCDPYDRKNKSNIKVHCIVFSMDSFIRNTLKDEARERIFNNMIAFQKQFIGKLPNSEPTEE